MFSFSHTASIVMRCFMPFLRVTKIKTRQVVAAALSTSFLFLQHVDGWGRESIVLNKKLRVAACHT